MRRARIVLEFDIPNDDANALRNGHSGALGALAGRVSWAVARDDSLAFRGVVSCEAVPIPAVEVMEPLMTAIARKIGLA